MTHQVPAMSIDDALEVAMPFGECKGWRLTAIAEKRPVTFCKLMRQRKRFYGDLMYALQALYNGPEHMAAKAVRDEMKAASARRQLLDNARL